MQQLKENISNILEKGIGSCDDLRQVYKKCSSCIQYCGSGICAIKIAD